MLVIMVADKKMTWRLWALENLVKVHRHTVNLQRYTDALENLVTELEVANGNHAEVVLLGGVCTKLAGYFAT